jgi:hypothetical protein
MVGGHSYYGGFFRWRFSPRPTSSATSASSSVSVDATISKLASGNSAGEKVVHRATDICATCFGAIQEGEFSNLFFAERGTNGKPVAPPKIAPVSS